MVIVFINYAVTPEYIIEAQRFRRVCEKLGSTHDCDHIYSQMIRKGEAATKPASVSNGTPTNTYTIPLIELPLEISGIAIGTRGDEVKKTLIGAKSGPCVPVASGESCYISSLKLDGLGARNAWYDLRGGLVDQIRIEFDSMYYGAVQGTIAKRFGPPHDSSPSTSIWRFKNGGKVVAQSSEKAGRMEVLLLSPDQVTQGR